MQLRRCAPPNEVRHVIAGTVLDCAQSMVPVVLDLFGDREWHAESRRARIAHVDLSAAAIWTDAQGERPMIVDGRGKFEESIALLRMVRVATNAVRVLITDRIEPRHHATAYLAGATKIIVMSCADPLPELDVLLG